MKWLRFSYPSLFDIYEFVIFIKLLPSYRICNSLIFLLVFSYLFHSFIFFLFCADRVYGHLLRELTILYWDLKLLALKIKSQWESVFNFITFIFLVQKNNWCILRRKTSRRYVVLNMVSLYEQDLNFCNIKIAESKWNSFSLVLLLKWLKYTYFYVNGIPFFLEIMFHFQFFYHIYVKKYRKNE